MHKNLIKIAHVVPGISSRTDRQIHTQTCSSQYFATAPAAAGEVIKAIGYNKNRTTMLGSKTTIEKNGKL